MKPESLCRSYRTYEEYESGPDISMGIELNALRADVRALAERLGDPFGKLDLYEEHDREWVLALMEEARRVRAALLASNFASRPDVKLSPPANDKKGKT